MNQALVSTNLDLIGLTRGLALLIVSGCCARLRGREIGRVPWGWFGLFSLSAGLHAWLETLAISVGDSPLFLGARTLVLALSFTFLLRIGQTGMRRPTGRSLGPWIMVFLLGCAAAGALAGADGLDAGVRCALGLPSGLWAAWTLWTAARGVGGKRDGSLTIAAIAIGAYAVFSCAVAPRVPFLPAPVFGGASVLARITLPAELFGTLSAWVLALSLSRHAELRFAEKGAPAPWRRSSIVRLGLPLALLITTGWCAVNWLGHREDARQRALLLDMTRSFAVAIPTTELDMLTATEADLGSPTYLQMKNHLRVLRENMPGARFLYLMRKTDGVLRFLADSEPVGSKDESPAGQAYGESTEGLERVFATNTPLVEGPIEDSWGVWVSALVPLSESPGGTVAAVLGLDQDANAFQQAVAAERLKGILALLLALTAIVAGWALRRRAVAELRADDLDGRPDLVLRWGVPALVLFAGTGLFVPAFMDARRQAHESFDSAFRHHAVEHMEVYADGVSRQLIELGGMASFLNSVSPVDQTMFARYSKEVQSKNRAIKALAWVPRVRWADRPSFEAGALAKGQGTFQICQRNREGKLEPAGRRPEYFPVCYLSPSANRDLESGLDLAMNPACQAALDRARDDGLPAATEPIRSEGQEDGPAQFVVFVPVYAFGGGSGTREERREHLRGFAVGLYRMDTLFFEATQKLPDLGLASFLDDLDAPPGHQELLRSAPPLAGRFDWVAAGRLATYQGILNVASRSWRLSVVPGTGFVAVNLSRWYRLILPFGMILSALAAFLASQMLNRRLEAQRRSRQNQRLTEEQSRLNERFSLAADAAGIGVWDLDLLCGTLVWDDGMHSLYGMPSAETVLDAEAWQERIHPDDRTGVRSGIEDGISGIGKPDMEFRIIWPTGEVRHLKSHARIIRDESGTQVRVTGISYDVTERNRIEELRLGSLDRQERLNRMQQVLLAPGDLALKLATITDGVVEIFGADFCRVWRISRGDLCDRGCIHAGATEGPHACRDREKCLHLMASSGRYTHLDGVAHRRVPFGAYKIGLVASGEEHRFLTNDVVHDPKVHNREWARELGLVSFAGYQLRPPGGDTLGVLALFSRRALTAEDDAQLDALSNTAAQVIHADQIDLLLRRERILLRTVIDHIPYAIHAKDTQGHKTLTNLADERMFGLTPPDHAEGEPGPDDVGHEEAARDREGDRSVILSGQPILHREKNVVDREGRRVWLDTSRLPLRDEEEVIVGMVGIGQDITERKEAEEARTQMEIQLRHAQKMESIGQLAAGIAHEINTPTQFIGDNNRFLQEAFGSLQEVLTRLRPVLDAARQGPVPAELVQEATAALEAADLDFLMAEVPNALAQSLEGVARVAKIVGAMKQFSHPGGEDFIAANINDAIESTASVCRNEWKYVADLVTDFDPALPPFPCLLGDVNQVILNLIINAAHAIAEATQNAEQGKGTITVSTRRDGDWAEVRVSDTGAGIPERVRDSIFTPFFTTKPVGKGTGQGLAIARSVVVDKHGGTISFESEVGRGTTFIVRLPLDRQASLGRPNPQRLAA